VQRYDYFPKYPKIFKIFIRLSQYVKERASRKQSESLLSDFAEAKSFFEAEPQRTRVTVAGIALGPQGRLPKQEPATVCVGRYSSQLSSQPS
jgi:hypothetical protein